MSLTPPETVEAAEQRVRAYLAKRAGRPAESEVPRSEREPFGANIELVARNPADDARFTEIGYCWNGGNAVECYNTFLEQSEDRQLRILDDLLDEASRNSTFHAALGELLSRLVSAGRVSAPSVAQIHARYALLPRPPAKRGPNKASRDALVLNLMQILTGPEFRLEAKRGETSTSESNACAVVARVLAKEFPSLNLSFDAVRGIWDKRVR